MDEDILVMSFATVRGKVPSIDTMFCAGHRQGCRFLAAADTYPKVGENLWLQFADRSKYRECGERV